MTELHDDAVLPPRPRMSATGVARSDERPRERAGPMTQSWSFVRGDGRRVKEVA
ncbi:MAG: hypothetical protein OJF58_000591 [Enhydrobacter sp.]|nr:MAG: hypothetical protein OJF58_000591 [Enhydrobacter sp.]